MSAAADDKPVLGYDTLRSEVRAQAEEAIFDFARAMPREAERKAKAAEEQARRDAEQARLHAEEAFLLAANLRPMRDSNADGIAIGTAWGQAPVRISANAHPMTLAAASLSRVQRCEQFALLLEDAVKSEAAFQLTRIIEEVAALLVVLAEHRGLANAPWPETTATKGATA